MTNTAQVAFPVPVSTEQLDIWLAAFFDGEGGFHIGYDKGYNSYKMYITQSHCDELLYVIQEILDFGWVEEGHAWRCAGKESCETLLNRIENYLIVKRKCAGIFRKILGTIRTEGRDLTDEQLTRRKELLDEWQATCTRAAQNARNAPLKIAEE